MADGPNMEGYEQTEVPTQELAFIAENTLKTLTSPANLNSGDLHNIYVRRQDDFEEPELLEVQYADARGGLIRELIFVDPVYAEKRPRICVSIEGVQAMHRAIGVLSRKVDNLVHTLRSCRAAYYHELTSLREQVYQVSFAMEHNKEGAKPTTAPLSPRPDMMHQAMYFDPSQFDTNISDEILERKLKDATKEISEKLKASKEEVQRLEKRVKMQEKDLGVGHDPRNKIERLLETVDLQKMLEMIRAAMGRANSDDFYEVIRNMLNEWKIEKGMEPDKTVEEELEDVKRQVKSLLSQLSDTQARSAAHAKETDEIKKTLVNEREEHKRVNTALTDQLEAATQELNQMRESMRGAETNAFSEKAAYEKKKDEMEARLEEIKAELADKEQSLKRYVAAKRIAEAGAGKKIENLTPEEVVALAAEKMNKKEVAVMIGQLADILGEEEKAQLGGYVSGSLSKEGRGKLVKILINDGVPPDSIEEVSTVADPATAEKFVMHLSKKVESKHRQSIARALTVGMEEEERVNFIKELPDQTLKAVVVDSVNNLAHTMPSRESDSEDSVEEGKKGKVLFDPEKDLNRKARRALLQKFMKRLPGHEIKQLAESMGPKARSALYETVFEEQDCENIKRAVNTIVSTDAVQAVADGLSEDAANKLESMLANKTSREAEVRPAAGGESPRKKAGFGVGVQTDLQGIGICLLPQEQTRKLNRLAGRPTSGPSPAQVSKLSGNADAGADENFNSQKRNSRRKSEGHKHKPPNSREGHKKTRSPYSSDAGSHSETGSPKQSDAHGPWKHGKAGRRRPSHAASHSSRPDSGTHWEVPNLDGLHTAPRGLSPEGHLQEDHSSADDGDAPPGTADSHRVTISEDHKNSESSVSNVSCQLKPMPIEEIELSAEAHALQSAAELGREVSEDRDDEADQMESDADHEDHDEDEEEEPDEVTPMKNYNSNHSHDSDGQQQQQGESAGHSKRRDSGRPSEIERWIKNVFPSFEASTQTIMVTGGFTGKIQFEDEEHKDHHLERKCLIEMCDMVLDFFVLLQSSGVARRVVKKMGLLKESVGLMKSMIMQGANVGEVRQMVAEAQAPPPYEVVQSPPGTSQEARAAAATHAEAVATHGADSEEAAAASAAYAEVVAAESQAQAEQDKEFEQAQPMQEGHFLSMSEQEPQFLPVPVDRGMFSDVQAAGTAHIEALVKHGEDSAEAAAASERYLQVVYEKSVGHAAEYATQAAYTQAVAEGVVANTAEALLKFEDAVAKTGLSENALNASRRYVEMMAEAMGIGVDELLRPVHHSYSVLHEDSCSPPEALMAAMCYSNAVRNRASLPEAAQQATEEYYEAMAETGGLPEDALEASDAFAAALEQQAGIPQAILASSLAYTKNRLLAVAASKEKPKTADSEERISERSSNGDAADSEKLLKALQAQKIASNMQVAQAQEAEVARLHRASGMSAAAPMALALAQAQAQAQEAEIARLQQLSGMSAQEIQQQLEAQAAESQQLEHGRSSASTATAAGAQTSAPAGSTAQARRLSAHLQRKKMERLSQQVEDGAAEPDPMQALAEAQQAAPGVAQNSTVLPMQALGPVGSAAAPMMQGSYMMPPGAAGRVQGSFMMPLAGAGGVQGSFMMPPAGAGGMQSSFMIPPAGAGGMQGSMMMAAAAAGGVQGAFMMPPAGGTQGSMMMAAAAAGGMQGSFMMPPAGAMQGTFLMPPGQAPLAAAGGMQGPSMMPLGQGFDIKRFVTEKVDNQVLSQSQASEFPMQAAEGSDGFAYAQPPQSSSSSATEEAVASQGGMFDSRIVTSAQGGPFQQAQSGTSLPAPRGDLPRHSIVSQHTAPETIPQGQNANFEAPSPVPEAVRQGTASERAMSSSNVNFAAALEVAERAPDVVALTSLHSNACIKHGSGSPQALALSAAVAEATALEMGLSPELAGVSAQEVRYIVQGMDQMPQMVAPTHDFAQAMQQHGRDSLEAVAASEAYTQAMTKQSNLPPAVAAAKGAQLVAMAQHGERSAEAARASTVLVYAVAEQVAVAAASNAVASSAGSSASGTRGAIRTPLGAPMTPQGQQLLTTPGPGSAYGMPRGVSAGQAQEQQQQIQEQQKQIQEVQKQMQEVHKKQVFAADNVQSSAVANVHAVEEHGLESEEAVEASVAYTETVAMQSGLTAEKVAEVAAHVRGFSENFKASEEITQHRQSFSKMLAEHGAGKPEVVAASETYAEAIVSSGAMPAEVAAAAGAQVRSIAQHGPKSEEAANATVAYVQAVAESAGAVVHPQLPPPSSQGLRCPTCGNTYMADANFCRKCGNQRPEAKQVFALDPSSEQGALARKAPIKAAGTVFQMPQMVPENMNQGMLGWKVDSSVSGAPSAGSGASGAGVLMKGMPMMPMAPQITRDHAAWAQIRAVGALQAIKRNRDPKPAGIGNGMLGQDQMPGFPQASQFRMPQAVATMGHLKSADPPRPDDQQSMAVPVAQMPRSETPSTPSKAAKQKKTEPQAEKETSRQTVANLTSWNSVKVPEAGDMAFGKAKTEPRRGSKRSSSKERTAAEAMERLGSSQKRQSHLTDTSMFKFDANAPNQGRKGSVDWGQELASLPGIATGAVVDSNFSEESSGFTSDEEEDAGREGAQLGTSSSSRSRPNQGTADSTRSEADRHGNGNRLGIQGTEMMRASLRHTKTQAKLIHDETAAVLRKEVEKGLQNEQLASVRRSLQEDLGADQIRELEASVAATAMNNFMAIASFLKTSGVDLTGSDGDQINDRLAEAHATAMKCSVEHAVRIYKSMGKPEAENSDDASNIVKSAAAPLLGRTAGQHQGGRLRRNSHDQDRSALGVADMEGLAGLAGEGFGKLRTMMPKKTDNSTGEDVLEEPPPGRAANAEEWLNFFQGKTKGRASGGVGIGAPAFTQPGNDPGGTQRLGLRTRLKPLRTQQKSLPGMQVGNALSSTKLQEGKAPLAPGVAVARERPVIERQVPQLGEGSLEDMLEIRANPVTKAQKQWRAAAALAIGTKPPLPGQRVVQVVQSAREARERLPGEDLEAEKKPTTPRLEPLNNTDAHQIDASRWLVSREDGGLGDIDGPRVHVGPQRVTKRREGVFGKKLAALPGHQAHAEKLSEAGGDSWLHVKTLDSGAEKTPRLPGSAEARRRERSAEGRPSTGSSSQGSGDYNEELEVQGMGRNQRMSTVPKEDVHVPETWRAVKDSGEEEPHGEEYAQQQKPHSARIMRGRAFNDAAAIEDVEYGSLTERAIVPIGARSSLQGSQGRKRGSDTIGALVSRVRNQLETTHGSLAASWVHVESQYGEAGLTLGGLQRGMVEAGVLPDDAGIFIQAMLESQMGSAAATIPGDRAPARADFVGALMPGKLRQQYYDAAQRRASSGSAWWSEGRVSPNFHIQRYPDGLTARDANTILTSRPLMH